MTDTEAAAARLAEDDVTITLKRTLDGETVNGLRVAAYMWEKPVPEELQGSKTYECVAFHWSTGPAHAERLFHERDVLRLLRERAEHLAHPAPAAVVGVTDEGRWETPQEALEYAGALASHPEDFTTLRAARTQLREIARFASDVLAGWAAAPPVPPAVVPGWRPTGFNLPVSHWGAGKIVSAEDTVICECHSAQMTGEVIAALNAHWLASAPRPGEAK